MNNDIFYEILGNFEHTPESSFKKTSSSKSKRKRKKRSSKKIKKFIRNLEKSYDICFTDKQFEKLTKVLKKRKHKRLSDKQIRDICKIISKTQAKKQRRSIYTSPELLEFGSTLTTEVFSTIRHKMSMDVEKIKNASQSNDENDVSAE